MDGILPRTLPSVFNSLLSFVSSKQPYHCPFGESVLPDVLLRHHLEDHLFHLHYSISLLRTQACGLHTFFPDSHNIEKLRWLRRGAHSRMPGLLLHVFGDNLGH